MTATLERRISKLETVFTPPPPPPDREDGGGRWWPDAPEPVIAYLIALAKEVEAAGIDPQRDPKAGAMQMIEAHPLYCAIATRVGDTRKAGHWGDLTADERLRQIQHALLCGAHNRLTEAITVERRQRRYPDNSDVALQRLCGVPLYERVEGLYDRHAEVRLLDQRNPEVFVDQWRATGTTDPTTLAQAGLHAAELTLLAA